MDDNKVIDFYGWKHKKDKVLPCLFCIHYIGDKDGCSELGEVPDKVWFGRNKCEHMIDIDEVDN